MLKILDYSKKPIPEGKIIETWEKCFNNKFNIDYFNWRFLANPNEKKVFIKYIIENDTLAAYYSVSPMLLQRKDGGTIKVALANMTMTHPDYRGKGYSRKLALELYAQLKEEGYACIFTYPIREAMCYIFRKYLNFHDITILKTMHLSKDNLKQNSTANYTFEHDEVNEKIINIAQYLTFTDKNFLLLRDKANLKWRLIDNPINNYYYLKITRDNKVRVVIFYKGYEDSIDIMDYCYSTTDYLWESDFSYGLAKLFSKNKFTSAGINIWTDIDSNEFNFLKNIGFCPTLTNTYFGIIPLSNDETLLSKENWHNRYFDSDVF